MAIEVVTEFLNEETVWVLAYIYNQRTGAAVDPTAVTLTISNSDGIAQISNQAMTKYAVGEYEYFYNIASSATKKWWRGLVKVVDGSGASAKASIGVFGFKVK